MYKTSPKRLIEQQNAISWKDEDMDIVATPQLLALGVSVNWTRENVTNFRSRIQREGNFKEANDINELYMKGQIICFRAQQFETYFLMGPLVKEFMLLSKAIKDYQHSINYNPITNMGINIIESKFLNEAELRYKELISIFDKFVGLKLVIDEELLYTNPSQIHYLFIKNN